MLLLQHPEIRNGLLCLGKAESALPKPPKPAPGSPGAPKPTTEVKRFMMGGEVVEVAVKIKEAPTAKKVEVEDKEPEKPKPQFPVAPKEPLKPGTLPHLENIIWDMPLLYKIREVKQPAMIPDALKFPDPEVNKFSGIFGIKSILFLPFFFLPMIGEEGAMDQEVMGVIAAMTVTDFKVVTQIEINYAQKIVQALSKYVANAPPDLPVNIKKAITAISKDEASDKLIEYYSGLFDDIFDLIIYEIGPEKCNEKFLRVLEERNKIYDESKLKKIWFQMSEVIRGEGELGSIAKRAVHELFQQAFEFTQANNRNMPTGFKGLNTYVRKNIKYTEIKDLGLEAEIISGIEEQIDNALRGNALFTDKTKAVLINDVEQSNMLMNYISAPSAMDFRNHIRAAIEETIDCPEDIDKDALLNDMCYHGLSEISKAVCQDLVEKVLFDIPEFLEQPQEKQSEQSEALVTHFHRKIMANLIAGLKGKKSVWINHVSNEIKNRAKEAAKKRAVMVGRINNDDKVEEDY